jgi:hypothetical protein
MALAGAANYSGRLCTSVAYVLSLIPIFSLSWKLTWLLWAIILQLISYLNPLFTNLVQWCCNHAVTMSLWFVRGMGGYLWIQPPWYKQSSWHLWFCQVRPNLLPMICLSLCFFFTVPMYPFGYTLAVCSWFFDVWWERLGYSLFELSDDAQIISFAFPSCLRMPDMIFYTMHFWKSRV